MKKLLLTFVLLVGIVFGLFAQKLTYQAVVRDNNQQLVTNTAVKATVTIDFTGDQADYDTTITDVSTNIHGLLSFEFGGKTLNGRDWTGATIAVKVVNAATPSIVYVNGDTRPVSAVPYALSVDGQSIQNYLTEHHYVDLDKLNDTLGAYPTTAVMDARHYLTSDSAVIIGMQNNIAKNADGIDNLILHTAKAAIRDSVAGQIHDSISNIAAKAHTHDNKALLDNYTQTEADLADAVTKRHAHTNADILNNTTAPYTDADSAKLHDIAAGAEVNVQADWNQTTTTADDYIKNKPTIPKTVAELSDAGNYVKNADLTNLLNAMNAKIDSLARIVDSLSNLTPGGGDEPATFTCGTSKVKDADLNEYNTVKIGSQCWTKENLKTKKYADGQVISSDKMFNPDDNADKVATYGKLYTWSAATRDSSTTYPAAGQVKVQGICPAGWHVPSDAEWTALTNYVNTEANGYRCNVDGSIAKALASKTGWDDDGTNCNVGKVQENNNATGFSAVPAGIYSYEAFESFGLSTNFWSATKYDGGNAYRRSLYSYFSAVSSDYSEVDSGFSVRCLRD